MDGRLIEVVLDVEKKLVSGDLGSLASRDKGSRFSMQGVRAEIERYGRTLVEPPPEVLAKALDVVEVRDSTPRTWLVTAPLFTREEGESDLCIELRVMETVPEWSYAFEDILVP